MPFVFFPASTSAFIHYNSNIQTSRTTGRADKAGLLFEAYPEFVLARDRGRREANAIGYKAAAEN